MINKVILMGRLTKDPELRTTNSGSSVTTFTLAVDRGIKRNGDSAQQTADFFDIVCWEQKADFARNWFKKGQLVAVVGKLQNRKWQDKNGQNRVSTEVIAEELHFAESKRDSASSANNYPAQQYGAPYASPAQRDTYSQPGIPAEENDGFSALSDDSEDLPF